MERVNGYAPSLQRWQRRGLLLHHTRIMIKTSEARTEEYSRPVSPQLPLDLGTG